MSDSMARTPEMTHEEAVRTMAAERYLLDEMAGDERDAFETHYFSCGSCAEDLRMANLVREEVSTAAPMVSPPATARATGRGHVLRPARWSGRLMRSAALPWAVAASLAVIAGYQSVGTGGTRQAGFEPRALAPIVLRGTTRGAVPIVMPGEAPVIALSLDVTEPAARQLNFDLLGPRGDTLLSGSASVPPPGVPLLLLVPSDRLAESGRHRLVVRDSARPESIPGEYAFDVSR